MPDVATALLETLRENQAQTNAGLTVVSAAVARVQAAIERVGNALGAARPAGQLDAGALAKAGGAGEGVGEEIAAAAGGGSPLGAAVQAIRGAVASVAEAVKFIAGLPERALRAINLVFDSFNALSGKIRPFAEAINPVSVQLFDQAMRDTTAVIGEALLPVWRALTGLVRELGNALVPVAAQLKPVFETIGQTIAGVGKSFIGFFANLLTALRPAFERLADLFAGLGAALQGFFAFLSGIVSAIASLFGGGVATNFKEAMQKLTEGLLVASAALLQFIDGLLGTSLRVKFLEGAAKAFGGGEKGDSTGKAPPTSASVTDLTSLTKAVAAAAYVAGEAGKNPEDEWRKKMLDLLTKLSKMSEDQFIDNAASIIWRAFFGKQSPENFAAQKGLKELSGLLEKVNPLGAIIGPLFGGFASR